MKKRVTTGSDALITELRSATCQPLFYLASSGASSRKEFCFKVALTFK